MHHTGLIHFCDRPVQCIPFEMPFFFIIINMLCYNAIAVMLMFLKILSFNINFVAKN